jgi:hypothetical protein
MTAIKSLADSLLKLELGMRELNAMVAKYGDAPIPPLATANHRGEYTISDTGAKHVHVFMTLHSKGIEKCYDCGFTKKLV